MPGTKTELNRAMNEKIDKLLGGCPGYPLSLSAAEQQVWLDAQRAILEAGYRKPQQPAEGKLVDACKGCDLRINGVCVDIEFNKADCERWDLAQAQRDHMIAQGFRTLPSEERAEEIARALNGREADGGFLRLDTQVRILLEMLGERA